MKKLKRISALLGVFILIAMYLCTLIFALIDSPVASDLLKSIYRCNHFRSCYSLWTAAGHTTVER